MIKRDICTYGHLYVIQHGPLLLHRLLKLISSSGHREIIRAGMSNYIPWKIMDIITFPWANFSLSMLLKGAPLVSSDCSCHIEILWHYIRQWIEPSSGQVIAKHPFGDKPLAEPMITYHLFHTAGAWYKLQRNVNQNTKLCNKNYKFSAEEYRSFCSWISALGDILDQ